MGFRLFILGLVYITNIHLLLGQNKLTYVSLGVGTSYYSLRDSTVSPLTYRGNPFAAALDLEIRRPKAITRIILEGDIGRLRAGNATKQRPMQNNLYRIDFSFQHYRWLADETASWRWYIGGTYRWHNSIRITPQNDTGMISFLIANSVAMAGGGERQFNILRKKATFNWQAEVPVISHVIRPSYLNLYNYIDPENNFLNERLSAGKWATINRFPSAILHSAISLPIAGQNQLKLSYDWAFYHYPFPSIANVGRHSILLHLLVRI